MLTYELTFHELTTYGPQGCHSTLEVHLYGLRLKPSFETACFWAGTNRRLPTLPFLRAWRACDNITMFDYATLCTTLDTCPTLTPDSDVSHLSQSQRESLLGGLVFADAVFENRAEAHAFCQRTKLAAMCLFLCDEYRILPVNFYQNQLIRN
jgi:hypothetical protein